MRKRVVKAVFLLPIEDNDGSDLSDLIGDFEAKLATELDSGWTQFAGYFSGAYKMQEKEGFEGKDNIKKDITQKFFVIFEGDSEKSIEKDIEKLKELLIEFKSKTTQESIYFEINRNCEFLML